MESAAVAHAGWIIGACHRNGTGNLGGDAVLAIRVVTWNVEWIRPKFVDAIRQQLDDARPDIAVITEGRLSALPDLGSSVSAGEDWGYRADPDRRKVLLWSRFPLRDSCRHEDLLLPPGRLVTTVCETARGPVWIAAVCVPWRDAHVRSGRRDAAPWQEHRDFLHGLRSVIESHRMTCRGSSRVISTSGSHL